MTLSSIAAGVGVLLLAVAWYGLQIAAIRDLRQRPRVRGNNKLAWAFAILCLPYAGALGYLTFGPTSFLPRPRRLRVMETDTTSSQSPEMNVAPARKRAAASQRPMVSPPDAVTGVPRPKRSASNQSNRRLAFDPVIGTDSADLLLTRVTVVRSRRAAPDAIRWPGSVIPHALQSADAESHN